MVTRLTTDEGGDDDEVRSGRRSHLALAGYLATVDLYVRLPTFTYVYLCLPGRTFYWTA